jgi:hypothetical protein
MCLVSSRTGIDLTVDIVAVKDGKSIQRVLGITRDAMAYPKNPSN